MLAAIRPVRFTSATRFVDLLKLVCVRFIMNCQARRARQIWYHDRSAEYRSLDGILVQLPLPSHIDAQKVTSAIDPKTLMAFIR
ncbi:hypothetical protein ABIB73_007576 [Bradyrhizobium sp. F1.4.3]